MVSQKLRRWRDRGAAAVEFAIIVPALVILIFGSIEFGLAVNARTMVVNAAREGVRVASLEGSTAPGPADIQTATQNAVSGLPGTPTITVTCVSKTGGTCTIGTDGAAQGVATVTVQLAYTGITGMFPFLNGNITASSTMRIE